MAELKTKLNDGSVDEFLNSVEDEQKRKDSFRIREIMEEITGAPGQMWGKSIVGFGSYHYKYASGREGDWMLVGFSPRKQNISLYIMDGVGSHDDLLENLGKYKHGKSCLYVKRLSEVDESVLRDMITRSVKRLREKKWE